MMSSNVNYSSTHGAIKLQERYYSCSRRAAIKISHSKKHPNLVYVKCEANICGFFDWVRQGDLEYVDSVDSVLRPPVDNTDIASLCEVMTRIQKDIAMMKRQFVDFTEPREQHTKMPGMGTMVAMAIVLVGLFYVFFVK